jgi:DNA polymerase-3 subunit beta
MEPLKLNCIAGDLAHGLEFAQRIVDPKAAKKIAALGFVVIAVADKGAVTLLVNDLDRAAVVTLPAEATTPGRAAISIDRLTALTNGFRRDTRVTLATSDAVVIVAAGRSRYRLSTIPVEDMPRLFQPAGGDAADLTLPPDGVKKLFARTKFCISQELTRHYLCGTYLHRLDSHIVAAATDGHTLAEARVRGEFDGSGVIVPAKTVEEIERLAKIGDVTLRFDSKVLEARAGARALYSKLIDATFPDYQRVIPVPSANSFEVDRATLVEALTRLNAVADGKRPSVGITWADNTVSLCIPESDGTADDQVPAVTTGAARIAVAISKLSKILDEIEVDRLYFDTADERSPLRISIPGDENFVCLLMPMKWRTS